MRILFLSIIFLTTLTTRAQVLNTDLQMQHLPMTADKTIMYEIFVRNFSKQGNLKGVTSRLIELRAMGINTLWLMPIQPTGIIKRKGAYGSPYAIKNYTEVHPDYGTKADFKQLVDSCHALGMSIIIDHVANHTSWDNPWVKAHPDWFTKDAKGNIIPSVPDWTDIADLNYSNKEMRAEMIKSLKYWVKEFDIDGYRCDVAEMVPNDFWKDAIDSLRKIKNVLMLAEGADPLLYDAGFNITYGWDYYHNLKKVFKGEEPISLLNDAIIAEKKKFPSNARQLRFITNHDENSWDNTPNVLFGGIEGTKAAFVLMACTPGVPFVYNGQEVAYPTRINLFEKYVIDYSANPVLNIFYSSILNLYDFSDALRNGTYEYLDLKTEDVYGFIRKYNDETYLILVNVRNKEVSFTRPDIIKAFSQLMLGEKISNNATQILAPYGYQIIKL